MHAMQIAMRPFGAQRAFVALPFHAFRARNIIISPPEQVRPPSPFYIADGMEIVRA